MIVLKAGTDTIRGVRIGEVMGSKKRASKKHD
jgi:hypothetical protein